MYPHTPPPEDYDNKYGGPVPTPPPGAPVTPRQGQHQHYPQYPATGMQYQPSRWSTGLCHCCDDPANCMITCACPCITFGQIAEIVDRGSTSCARSGTRYALLVFTGLACLFSCFYRSRMRAQYDLEEAPFADCLVHFLCEPCALCQEYRELKNHDYDMGIGWEANMDRRVRGITTAPGIPRDMIR